MTIKYFCRTCQKNVSPDKIKDSVTDEVYLTCPQCSLVLDEDDFDIFDDSEDEE